MRTREQEVEPFVNLSEITEVELRLLKRMREFTIGEHASLFHGAGFDFVGLREWEAGDRFEHIDWAQSSLTNFSPFIVRDFEQPSTSGVVIVADRSASTRCGMDGVPIAVTIARAIATIGMSAVFFQDSVGLVVFGDGFGGFEGLRPRVGKGQVVHCLDAYQHGTGLQPVRAADSFSGTIAGFMRKTSLVPVVSDFLVEDPAPIMKELSDLDSLHDVVVVMVDAAFAYELPAVSAGWIDAFDVETGRSRIVSRREATRLATRASEWQDEVAAVARRHDLEVLRLGLDQTRFDIAFLEWVAERRLRRK
ncbi:MAG: DUF58 domain-containing protein [Vicinamibacterales bacterium]